MFSFFNFCSLCKAAFDINKFLKPNRLQFKDCAFKILHSFYYLSMDSEAIDLFKDTWQTTGHKMFPFKREMFLMGNKYRV